MIKNKILGIWQVVKTIIEIKDCHPMQTQVVGYMI